MEKEVKKSSGINIGSASIIMVFSVLCLTVFAVLTYMTANNEYNLATKSAYGIKDYYSADAKATITKAKILEIIEENGNFNDIMVATNNSKLDVIATADYQSCTFEYAKDVDDNQQLQVVLLYDGNELKTVQWKLVNVAEWSADGGINLWDGEF